MDGKNKNRNVIEGFQRVPAANLKLIDILIDRLCKEIPESIGHFDEIQVKLSPADIETLKDLVKYARSYGELYRQYHEIRQIMDSAARAMHEARTIFDGSDGTLAQKRTRALEVLGFRSQTDEIVADYSFFIDQFQRQPLERNWFYRMPNMNFVKKYESLFSKVSNENSRNRNEISRQIIELIAEKYRKTYDAVRQQLHRADIRNLPRD